MTKQEIIKIANKGHNPVWDLVKELERLGRITKVEPNTIRKPAVYISEKQQLVNLTETELLIVERESATGPITNYRLLVYNLKTGHVEGAYNPFG